MSRHPAHLIHHKWGWDWACLLLSGDVSDMKETSHGQVPVEARAPTPYRCSDPVFMATIKCNSDSGLGAASSSAHCLPTGGSLQPAHPGACQAHPTDATRKPLLAFTHPCHLWSSVCLRSLCLPPLGSHHL